MLVKHKSQDTGLPQPTRSYCHIQQQYADWFKTRFSWDWYITLTFSCDPSSERAKVLLREYLREIEVTARAPLACLIAEERTTYSGLGLPGGRVHFHLLIRGARSMNANVLREWWRQKRFGGDRTSGSSADARVYKETISATNYLFKNLYNSSWDWSDWRLGQASKRKPASFATSSKARRTWKRQQQRGRQLIAAAG